MALSLLVTSKLESISGAWKFILACSGGIGPVLILRWFWWRINAWSEISALIAPFVVYPILISKGFSYEVSLIIIVAWSTLVWTTVTFLTPATDEEKLISFYRKVHPGGAGWKSISAKLPEVKGDSGYLQLFVDWLAGCLMVMFSLFGVGKILFGQTQMGILFILIAAAAGAVIYWHLSRIGWEKLGD